MSVQDQRNITRETTCAIRDSFFFAHRLCAKGFTQKPGVDYQEISSPVVRYESVRIFLVRNLAAERNLEIKQFDVKIAFLLVIFTRKFIIFTMEIMITSEALYVDDGLLLVE